MRARCGFLTHGIAVHFERRAAASEIDAVAEEVLAAETNTHRVLKRPGEGTNVVLTVTVRPQSPSLSVTPDGAQKRYDDIAPVHDRSSPLRHKNRGMVAGGTSFVSLTPHTGMLPSML